MLDHTIQRYLDMYKQIREEAGPDPEEQFTAVVAYNFKDLNTRYTTVFFQKSGRWPTTNIMPPSFSTQCMDDTARF